MANYNIVVDTSNFKPYDINIPLGILRDYRDAYYRYEDALNKIAEENGMYTLPEPEEGNEELKRIYDLYQKYNNDFRTVSDDFSKGMNLRNALLVRDINRRYGLEVRPIKQAAEDYKTWKANILNIIARDGGDAIIGNKVSLYDFIGGRTPDLKYKSGEKVEKGATEFFKSVNNALMKDYTFKKYLDAAGYIEAIKQGANPANILEAAAVSYNDRHGGAYTGEIKDLLTKANQYFNSLDWDGFSEEARQLGWNKVMTGLVKSIDKPESTLIQDRDWYSAKDRLDMQKTRLDMANTAQTMAFNKQLQPYIIGEKQAGIAKTYSDIRHKGTSYRGSSSSSNWNNYIADLKFKALAGDLTAINTLKEVEKVNKLIGGRGSGSTSNPSRGLAKPIDWSTARAKGYKFFYLPPGVYGNKGKVIKIEDTSDNPTIRKYKVTGQFKKDNTDYGPLERALNRAYKTDEDEHKFYLNLHDKNSRIDWDAVWRIILGDNFKMGADAIYSNFSIDNPEEYANITLYIDLIDADFIQRTTPPPPPKTQREKDKAAAGVAKRAQEVNEARRRVALNSNNNNSRGRTKPPTLPTGPITTPKF